MNTRLSILFLTKKVKTNALGLLSIYLRVTINRQRWETSTKRLVEPGHWSATGGRVKANIQTEEAKSLNAFLDSLKNRVYELQRQIIHERLEFNISNFKNKWLGITDRPRKILEIFRHHNDQMKKLVELGEVAAGTLERYETALTHLSNFIKWKFKTNDHNIKDLNYEFAADFDFWLKTVRRCCHNSSIKYVSQLKKMVHLCLKNDWLDKDPLRNFRLKEQEVKMEFLTNHELQTIQNKVFHSERIGQVRDIFIFCCYTGLAYIDCKNLTRNDIIVGIDGEKWISIKRQKTDTPSKVPLLPQALAILKKYENDPRCINRNILLPVYSNQKMNEYLKEIAVVCEINKRIRFHLARYTFGTTVTLGNGVPIETVSKMLGHKSLEQTQHYAKVMDQKISDDMLWLRAKLEKENEKVPEESLKFINSL